AVQLHLKSDTQISKEGYFQLKWELVDSVPLNEVEKTSIRYRLTEIDEFRESIVFYEGPETGIAISGKKDGIYRYQVQAWTNNENLESDEVIASDEIVIE